MAKAIDFKKSTTTTLKVDGHVDCDQKNIMTEEGNVTFEQLFKIFDDEDIVVTLKIKEDEELSLDTE